MEKDSPKKDQLSPEHISAALGAGSEDGQHLPSLHTNNNSFEADPKKVYGLLLALSDKISEQNNKLNEVQARVRKLSEVQNLVDAMFNK